MPLRSAATRRPRGVACLPRCGSRRTGRCRPTWRGPADSSPAAHAGARFARRSSPDVRRASFPSPPASYTCITVRRRLRGFLHRLTLQAGVVCYNSINVRDNGDAFDDSKASLGTYGGGAARRPDRAGERPRRRRCVMTETNQVLDGATLVEALRVARDRHMGHWRSFPLRLGAGDGPGIHHSARGDRPARGHDHRGERGGSVPELRVVTMATRACWCWTAKNSAALSRTGCSTPRSSSASTAAWWSR